MFKNLVQTGLLLVFLTVITIAQTSSIVLQGVLRDNQNRAVTDGNYQVTFAVYTVATGGTALWTSTAQTVSVQNGVFSAKLTGYPSSVNFTQQYYVGVTVVGQGAELAPRIELTAAPYAIALRGTDNVVPASGNVGIGTASPSTKLDVVGSAKVSGNIEAGDSVVLNSKVRFKLYGGGLFDNFNKPLVQQMWTSGLGDRIVLRPGGSTSTLNSLEVNSGYGIEAGSNTPFFLTSSIWGRGLRLASAFTTANTNTSDEYFIQRGGLEDMKNDLVIHFDNKNGSKLQFRTPSAARMVIDGNTGNVGIGTESPSAKLDVVGTVEMFGSRTVTSGSVTATPWYRVIASGTAATDLIVNARVRQSHTAASIIDLMGYVTGSVLIAQQRQTIGEGDGVSISFPVRKGDTYSVETNAVNRWDWQVVITPLGQ